MPEQVHLDEIAAVCADLTAAGVPTTADVEKVRVPGAWLRHTGFTFDRLGGFTHRTQLHLVVADNGYLRARDALIELLNKALPVVQPDEDPYFQGLQLDSNKPLPGLVVPLDLPSTYLDEE